MSDVDDLLLPFKEDTKCIHKCADCLLKCEYRELALDKDPDATCLIPMRREQSLRDGSRIRLLDEQIIKAYSQELLDFLLEEVRTEKNVKLGEKLLSLLLEIKKVYWPATQKNLNANVGLFDKQLEQWQDTRNNLVVIQEGKDNFKKEVEKKEKDIVYEI